MTRIGGYPTEPFTTAYKAAVADPEPPLEVERIFVQTDAWGSGEWRNVAPVIAAGRIPVVSTKLSGSWASAATGSNNTRLDGAVNGLVAIPGVKSLPITPYLSFHHEPEGDGTPADYNAMWKYLENRYLAKLKAAGWDMCVIIMGGTYAGWTKWTPAQMDSAVAGLQTKNVFADVYEKATTPAFRPPGDAKSPFRQYLDKARAMGWRAAMPEFGVHDTTDQTGFIKACVGYAPMKENEFILYYDRDAGEGGATGNAKISDNPAALREFAKLRSVAPVPEPEPDDCEERLAAAEASLAAAEASLAVAQAALADAEDALAASKAETEVVKAQLTAATQDLAEANGKIEAAIAALT